MDDKFTQPLFNAVLKGLLTCGPFELPMKKADEIEKVFRHGAGKHPNTAETYTHLLHAMAHFEKSCSQAKENESGLNHHAHAIARCVLAIYKIAESWNDEMV